MTAVRCNLRQALIRDAEILASIHRLSFDDAWSAAVLATMLTTFGTHAVIAEVDHMAAGFFLWRTVAEDAEVLTVAVLPAYRRRGLGRTLLDAALALAPCSGGTRMVLEVAADNRAAQALYQGAGFAPVGLRRRYYRRSRGAAVDALVMARPLAVAEGGSSPAVDRA